MPTYNGTSANDTLEGGDGDDIINGLAGNDTLYAGLGVDTLNGGDGDDQLVFNDFTGTRSGTFNGGAGTDTLFVSSEHVTFSQLTLSSIEKLWVNGTLWISSQQVSSLPSLIFSTSGTLQLTDAGAIDLINKAPYDYSVYASDFGNTIRTGSTWQTLNGGTGNDLFYAGDGNDALFGFGGNDTLNGEGGDDSLEGGAGDDTLNGGSGDDWIYYGTDSGNDVIDGGSGIDTLGADGDISGLNYKNMENLVSYSGNVTATIAQLLAFQQIFSSGFTLKDGGTIDFSPFINNPTTINASDFGNTITAGINDDTINGGAGNDTLFGGAGNDTLTGGLGADTLNGGDGFDTASYANATTSITVSLGDPRSNTGEARGDTYTSIEAIIGSSFDDSLNGSEGANSIDGGLGNDALSGFDGQDTILGGDGSDFLKGGLGADLLDGGNGFDIAAYTEAASGVTVFLGAPQLNTGEAAGDSFASIEGVMGSSFGDILWGTRYANSVDGGAGNDWLYGQDGQDTILGGDGSDVISGGLGADSLDGGAGKDVAFYRDATASVYSVATNGVKADMVDGHTYGISLDVANVANGFGEATGDTLTNIENIWGSNFDDIIRGSDSVGGQVYGFWGNDLLDGRGGNDVFYGGVGSDTIITGAGADDIYYKSYHDQRNAFGTLEPFEGGDTITDFTHGVDHVTVSRYWFGFGNIVGVAQSLTSQYADFITSGTTAISTKPTFFYDQATGQLMFDPDGTGKGAAVLMVTFSNNVNLTLSDIWTA